MRELLGNGRESRGTSRNLDLTRAQAFVEATLIGLVVNLALQRIELPGGEQVRAAFSCPA
jgi:hypothetical protein